MSQLPLQKKPLRMIAMCASHIGSQKRLDSLGAMLVSWSKQTMPIPLHLSVSTGTAELESGVVRLCEAFASKGGGGDLLLYLTPSGEGQAQFEHYAMLTKHVTGHTPTMHKAVVGCAKEEESAYSPTDPTFVLFSDDDDTWDPQRVEFFHRVLNNSAQAGELPRIYAALEESGPNDAGRLALEAALAKLPDAAERAQTRREYYHFAVRLSCLLDFVMRCDKLLLRHRFADCFFVRYLLTPQGRDGFPDLGSDMKRFHANSGNLYSASVPLGADLQASDRAHSSPYDALARQARAMLAQQESLCKRKHQEHENLRRKYPGPVPSLTREQRLELHVSQQACREAFEKHAKLVDMCNRLLLVDGFCCIMHGQYKAPSYDSFRVRLQSIEEAQDAMLGRQRSDIEDRFPDSMRPFYDKLVATDPEFLRFIRAPTLACLP